MSWNEIGDDGVVAIARMLGSVKGLLLREMDKKKEDVSGAALAQAKCVRAECVSRDWPLRRSPRCLHAVSSTACCQTLLF